MPRGVPSTAVTVPIAEPPALRFEGAPLVPALDDWVSQIAQSTVPSAVRLTLEGAVEFTDPVRTAAPASVAEAAAVRETKPNTHFRPERTPRMTASAINPFAVYDA